MNLTSKGGKMKRVFDIVTAIVIVSFLVACSSPVTPAAPAAQPTTQPFKVGLLSPGPVHDQGWDQTAYDAFVRIQDELGAQMSYVELADDPAAFQKAFRDYASQGYNMVLGHGFQFQ